MSNQINSNETPEMSFEQYEAIRLEGKDVSQPAPVETEQKEETTESGTDGEQAKEEKPETEEAEDKTDETEDSKESEESEDSSEEEKPKRKSGFQKRIGKLNARISEKEREIEYWRKIALEKGAENPEATESARPEGKPDPDAFESHTEYVEALADWKLEQRLKAEREKEQAEKLKAEQASLNQKHMERVEAFASKTEDFEDVISEVDDIPLSPAIGTLILQSENGPELMYELAKNRDEYERINKLAPLAAARELGRIEARLQKPEQTKPKVTKAPKPLSPVAGTKGAPVKSIDDPNITFEEYERIRREQLKKKYG